MSAPIQNLLDALRIWRSRRTAIRELMALDDRLLKDIGVPRGEIPAVVDGLLRGAPPARAPAPAAATGDVITRGAAVNDDHTAIAA